MIATFIHDWFGFPNGSVLTNLVATGICVLAGAWKVILWVRKLKRSHQELHDKLDRMHESHQALHDKIDRVHTRLGLDDQENMTNKEVPCSR